MMNLTNVQRAIKNSMKENEVKQTPLLMLLGAMEELGEAAHVLLKHEQKLCGYDNEEKFKAELFDAIGDTTIYLMQLCEEMKWDFEGVAVSVAQRVLLRNQGGYKKRQEE